LPSSRSYLFDNSGKEHRLIAEFKAGTLVAIAEEIPNWFLSHVWSERDLRGEQ
jgi:hypothetical protein